MNNPGRAQGLKRHSCSTQELDLRGRGTVRHFVVKIVRRWILRSARGGYGAASVNEPFLMAEQFALMSVSWNRRAFTCTTAAFARRFVVDARHKLIAVPVSR
jgi:hypothetical protein